MTPETIKRLRDAPIRQKSANGQPPPRATFTRRCGRCSACFLGLAYGRTGEVGLWDDMRWFCSQECYDEASAGEGSYS